MVNPVARHEARVEHYEAKRARCKAKHRPRIVDFTIPAFTLRAYNWEIRWETHKRGITLTIYREGELFGRQPRLELTHGMMAHEVARALAIWEIIVKQDHVLNP